MDNNIHDAFARVKASDELKTSTLAFLESRREPHRPAARPKLLAACALLAAVLLGTGVWRAVTVPVSYVSIDVNPSVELGLSRLNRVVETRAYNEDGTAALDGVELEGLTWTDAVERLLTSPAMEPYLSGDAALTVTVASASPQREEELMAGVRSCEAYRQYEGRCGRADMDTLSEAHGCGMSFGKYAAWQVLSACDSTVTVEECGEMTMAQIRDRIEACTHGAEGSGSGHHGQDRGEAGGRHGHGWE